MKEKENVAELLVPAFPIMHVGIGHGFWDYPLSRVLGSRGYTVRDIQLNGIGGVARIIYKGKNDMQELEVPPLLPPAFEYRPRTHFTDLILRYEYSEGCVSSIRWTRALLINFARIVVVDVEDHEFHSIRLNDRIWYDDRPEVEAKDKDKDECGRV